MLFQKSSPTGPKVKDTTRGRKKSALQSTQRFLPIAEIRSDTVMLKNGGLRAVLKVEALNFNLKSEAEQQGIIAGYEAFVNTIAFPLQIVIRSAKINIDPYLSQLRSTADTHTNSLLKDQTLAYADFIERLIDVADIMQKRFYVVVPFDLSTRKKTLFEQFFSWMQSEDTTGKAIARQGEFLQGARALKERLNLVQTGLENVGLTSRRLTTQDLIELYYQVYNPRTSEEQKLPSEETLKIDRTVL